MVAMFSTYRAALSSLIALGLLSSYATPLLAQGLTHESPDFANADSQPLSPANSAADSQPFSPTDPAFGTPSPWPNNAALINEADNDAYVLGPGDVVRFDIFNVPELTNDQSGNRLVSDNLYNVLVDGTINLPWIGRVSVRGLDLTEASQAVEQRYSEFIREPEVTLTLFTPRPMRVAVVGEVRRPGAYTTGPGQAPDGIQPNPNELRTVVQAIQAAGGITQLANIRNIEVRRPQLNGPDQVIPIDFFALLEDGSQAQNLLLRDGDTVVVPTASALNPEEAQALADANFSPNLVEVDVVGEVRAPGRVTIRPNATLNQAILAAGGFDDPRAQTGEVAFIRLNADGTVTNRTISVDLASGISDENNPALRENDIVVVSRSGLTQTSDFLTLLGGAATAIINPILGITSIFNQLDEIRTRERFD
ncbi:MAG: polysaccharide biosynthesis/export family protein [Spirulina sp.]